MFTVDIPTAKYKKLRIKLSYTKSNHTKPYVSTSFITYPSEYQIGEEGNIAVCEYKPGVSFISFIPAIYLPDNKKVIMVLVRNRKTYKFLPFAEGIDDIDESYINDNGSIIILSRIYKKEIRRLIFSKNLNNNWNFNHCQSVRLTEELEMSGVTLIQKDRRVTFKFPSDITKH